MSKPEEWELEKIHARQYEAIRKFGFITDQDLTEFLSKCKSSRKLVDGYFSRSTGWSTDEEHEQVSRALAEYIKAEIKKKKEPSKSKRRFIAFHEEELRVLFSALSSYNAREDKHSPGSARSVVAHDLTGEVLKELEEIGFNVKSKKKG